MVIPENVNYIEFYKAATAKGIKVQSRFPRVYVGHRNSRKDICFQVIVKGKQHKTFPLTKEGELAAHRYAVREIEA